MHPVICTSCTRNFLLQSSKSVTTQLTRIYTDKFNEIKLPPEPTTCCMSGCANCVWIDYAKEVSKLLDGNDDKVRELILSKISDPNLKMFLTMELRNLQQDRNDGGNK